MTEIPLALKPYVEALEEASEMVEVARMGHSTNTRQKAYEQRDAARAALCAKVEALMGDLAATVPQDCGCIGAGWQPLEHIQRLLNEEPKDDDD